MLASLAMLAAFSISVMLWKNHWHQFNNLYSAHPGEEGNQQMHQSRPMSKTKPSYDFEFSEEFGLFQKV